eukprot:scaffold88352_cov14-Prasinocladus_malaysianus.AAC.1
MLAVRQSVEAAPQDGLAPTSRRRRGEMLMRVRSSFRKAPAAVMDNAWAVWRTTYRYVTRYSKVRENAGSRNVGGQRAVSQARQEATRRWR